jgi:hypothetical protein
VPNIPKLHGTIASSRAKMMDMMWIIEQSSHELIENALKRYALIPPKQKLV